MPRNDHNTIVPPSGPLAQSVGIALRVVHIGIALLAVLWLCAGIRQIPADQRAVVQRFGRVVGVHGSGLLLAWPHPIDTIILLPGADQPLTQPVALPVPQPGVADLGNGGAAYLTGDGGVVLLAAVLVYRIDDPATYTVQQAHVSPALDREFRLAATNVAAHHALDDFLVTDPDRAQSGGQQVTEARQAVRAELTVALNAHLGTIANAGAGLGVHIDRIDLTPSLPEAAKPAFDAVLTASQLADEGVARERTNAERTQQNASRQADQVLASARATAQEIVGRASSQTAAIASLAAQAATPVRQALLDRLWREKLAPILRRAGQVSGIDPGGTGRVIISGQAP